MNPLLTVEHLSVRFGGLLAIEDLSFEVREGEVLSLIGPNGAGKTTAFNAITGYLAPSSGEIFFKNKKLNNMRPHQVAAQGLVRTFQKTSVFDGRSALEKSSSPRAARHADAARDPARMPSGARGARAGGRGGADFEFRESESRKTRSRARCPTASSACSRWRSRSRETEAAAARRAGVRHEPFGDRELHGEARRHRALGITVLLVEHDMKMVMASPIAWCASRRGASSPTAPPPRSSAIRK